MKIGIIVYGEFREFEIARKSWGIFDSLDCDFYFTTWSKSSQKNSYSKIDLNEDVTEELIKKYYPNSNIKIHDEKLFIPNTLGEWNNNVEKMIFHWKYGMKMIENKNVKYDLIILLRFDLYILYNRPPELFFNFNKNRTIYGLDYIKITHLDENNNKIGYFLNDVFLMGNQDVIFNMIKKIKIEHSYNIHDSLSKDILDLGYYVDVIDGFKCVPVRPNSRNLSEIDINYENLMNNHIEFNKNYKS